MTNKRPLSHLRRILAFHPFEDALSRGFGCSKTFLHRPDCLLIIFNLLSGYKSGFPWSGGRPLVNSHGGQLSNPHTVLRCAKSSIAGRRGWADTSNGTKGFENGTEAAIISFDSGSSAFPCGNLHPRTAHAACCPNLRKAHPMLSTLQILLNDGGAEGDRTPDLLIANETLYQLSYDPIQFTKSNLQFIREAAFRPYGNDASAPPAANLLPLTMTLREFRASSFKAFRQLFCSLGIYSIDFSLGEGEVCSGTTWIQSNIM